MEPKYNFLSDSEPTDEQLAELMREVGADVRRRAAEANRKFREEIHEQVRAAQENWAASPSRNKYTANRQK
jgi:hypothetical protein